MNISFLKDMNYHAATFIKRKDDMIMRTPGPAYLTHSFIAIFILLEKVLKISSTFSLCYILPSQLE
jgi:hypothetical protein